MMCIRVRSQKEKNTLNDTHARHSQFDNDPSDANAEKSATLEKLFCHSQRTTSRLQTDRCESDSHRYLADDLNLDLRPVINC
jgi:hypothetical protein